MAILRKYPDSRPLLSGLFSALLLLMSAPCQAEPLVVTLTTSQTTGSDPLKYYNGLALQLALEKNPGRIWGLPDPDYAADEYGPCAGRYQKQRFP